MSERGESKVEQLVTPEAIRKRMEEILREASSQQDAEQKITEALRPVFGFGFLGPIVTWYELKGVENALLIEITQLDSEQRAVLQEKMLYLMTLEGDAREKYALDLLLKTPIAQERGTSHFDLSKKFSWRNALVQIHSRISIGGVFKDGSYNVEAECLVLVNSN